MTLNRPQIGLFSALLSNCLRCFLLLLLVLEFFFFRHLVTKVVFDTFLKILSLEK